jgi:hypothetical protein
MTEFFLVLSTVGKAYRREEGEWPRREPAPHGGRFFSFSLAQGHFFRSHFRCRRCRCRRSRCRCRRFRSRCRYRYRSFCHRRKVAATVGPLLVPPASPPPLSLELPPWLAVAVELDCQMLPYWLRCDRRHSRPNCLLRGRS